MFNKLSEKLDQFIYFDTSTQGKSGRKVFIDPMLLPKYMDYVENYPSVKDATHTAVCNLSATAGGVTASKNLQSAHLHRSHCGSVVATYMVLQDHAEHSHGPGIYITDIAQAVNGETDKGPGFYNITVNNQSWRNLPIDDDRLPSLVGTIGSFFDNGSAQYSLDTTQILVGKFLHKNAAKYMTSEGFSLYYSPSYTIDGYGCWLPSQQQIGLAGPERLANIIINTQKQYWGDIDSPHLWYVFGDGATLLSKTLDVIERRGITQLNYHSFEFIDPNINMVQTAARLENLRSSSKFKNLSFTSVRSRFHQFTAPNSKTTGLTSSETWKKSVGPISAGQERLQRAVENTLPRISSDLEAHKNLTFTSLAQQFASMASGWSQ